MEKEILIKKWLDNELTADELKEFQQLDEYDSYMKLSDKAQLFKAPNFNSSEAYKKLHPVIEEKRALKSNKGLYKIIAQMAAAFIIGFTLVTVIFSKDITTVETMASQKEIVILPDNSIAQLNSMSEISYSEKTWEKERALNLDGEAYFKVAKGSKFEVETSAGIVSVHGTQFNVKNRENYFEVKCFEGLVSVIINGEETMLPAGNTFRIVKGNMTNSNTNLAFPTWIANESSFKSVPLYEVISEFERQYDVEVLIDYNTDILFTGMFVHTNKELALKSITIPFNLEYVIVNNRITLSKIE
ncbi:MAG: FecR family protein [Urechidicola sp.]|nr:FecR family protein [Urechidicola sp.]